MEGANIEEKPIKTIHKGGSKVQCSSDSMKKATTIAAMWLIGD